MNRRDAINEILLSLNELPLDTVDEVADVPTARIVDAQLEITKKRILSYGWEFNTITLGLYPNTQNHIVVPTSFLSINGSVDFPDVIMKDWKLFDKALNTFQFTGAVTCVVVEDIAFDDIPYTIANYIVQAASLQAYINIIGNTDDVSLRHKAMTEAKIEALRENAVNIDGNLVDLAGLRG